MVSKNWGKAQKAGIEVKIKDPEKPIKEIQLKDTAKMKTVAKKKKSKSKDKLNQGGKK